MASSPGSDRSPPPRGFIWLAARIRDSGIRLEVSSVSRGTLHGSVNRVRVSFLEFRYPLLARFERRLETGCPIADVRDIACMKLAAVAQRGSRKDFVDLWALLMHRRRLPAMLADYQKKFSVGDIASVLYGLGYFDDAETEPLPKMLVPVGWPEIRAGVTAALRKIWCGGKRFLPEGTLHAILKRS